MPSHSRFARTLSQRRIPFHLLKHRLTRDLVDTAHAAMLPAAQVIRPVALRVDDRLVLVLLPCDQPLPREALASRLAVSPDRLATGRENSVRLLGLALDQDPGVEVIVDDRLMNQPTLYLELDDPTELARIEPRELRQIFPQASCSAMAPALH